ncbi:hypothetical protein BD779DRAFT_1790287 [Infundibulicybe gibba]|nr:hypothetical protein BD779DRAFT_1790287 [Infundibulicybe gibba]
MSPLDIGRDGAGVDTVIGIYSQWGSAYRSDGIFFDEVATSATSDADGYFETVDLIVTFGGLYNNLSPTMPSRKQVVLLTEGPLRLPFGIVDELASALDDSILHLRGPICTSMIEHTFEASQAGDMMMMPSTGEADNPGALVQVSGAGVL